jgi:hypothetical protein
MFAEEAAARGAALDAEWDSISQITEASPTQYPPGESSLQELPLPLWPSAAHPDIPGSTVQLRLRETLRGGI